MYLPCIVEEQMQGCTWVKVNPQYQHRLEDEQIENNLGEKDLGLLVDERLDMTQPCALTAQRDKGVLGCLQSSVASRAREGILSLCSSLVRPHLQCCIQLWGHQHREDMDLLEPVQRRTPIGLRGGEHLF
ncbi:hypothetical protein HGM15179_000532 [Zosterops borbonicus]|uniref:Uncharacterized protein n=1 Tax=Zosterops borbonicus TaxID=364589 RepID=A0A8K1GZA0_9PASS|nr:hypothetical protein HGM15179_000532 [Zosterops borbonicus]